MIDLQKVNKEYEKGFSALQDVNLYVKKGEFVSLVGLSGAGKSTLMRLLMHELKPSSGTIIVDDINLEELQDKNVPVFRRKFGNIFQDFKLLSGKTAFENVGSC
jgi:cell division transport system ATP-binding protein